MARLVHKGSPNARPLEVPDEAVDAWTARGYVPVQDKPSPKKAPAKKAASSSKKK